MPSQSKQKLDFKTKFSKLKESEKRNLINSLIFLYQDEEAKKLLSYDFYLTHSKKVYISNANLDNLDLSRVNSLGLYFGTFHDGGRFRLSIEGSKFITPKQNFVTLNETSFKSYISAENLFLDEVEKIVSNNKASFLIVIYNQENLGSVSIKNNEILTYMPKSRKLDFNKVF